MKVECELDGVGGVMQEISRETHETREIRGAGYDAKKRLSLLENNPEFEFSPNLLFSRLSCVSRAPFRFMDET